MQKTSFPFKSVNLDEAINFEKKMSQCKIEKYLEFFFLTDTPWPTVDWIRAEYILKYYLEINSSAGIQNLE
jgi:hypothetical protein